MKTSALVLLAVLIAPFLDANVLAAVKFTETEVRDREAREGVIAIRDGVREAYFQNHNRVNAAWRLADLVHDSLDGTYIKASAFSVEFPANRPGWVRIKCREPFPDRNGPLVLEANLSGNEEVWTEPGPNWSNVGRAAVMVWAGLFLAFVVPFRARRRFVGVHSKTVGPRQPVVILALSVWWPVVIGVTVLALSNGSTSAFQTERPYELAILPLLLLLVVIECGQMIAAFWQELAPTRSRALLVAHICSGLTIGAVTTVFASIFLHFIEAIYAGVAATFAIFLLGLIPFMRHYSETEGKADHVAKHLRATEGA